MISYVQAIEIIERAVQPLPARSARIDEAAGMVAAGDVVSPAAVPSFDNAAMDGFALNSAATRSASAAAPVALQVAGSVAAGQPPPGAATNAVAWEIMTGAPMPAGCDAVLPLERASVHPASATSPARLLLTEPVAAGLNRRDAGSDFGAGELLVPAGTMLTPAAVMALSAAGCDTLQARPAPRVAVVTTGSELASSGLPDQRGRIRDANGPYLAAMLARLALPLVARDSVGDDAETAAGKIAALASRCDLVLTTGGVSAGRLDFMPAVVERLGGEVLFHKVAIRPGKPLLFARLPQGAWLVGLPGNPMAVAVGLRFFVLAAVRALMGRERESFPRARAQQGCRKRRALTFFAKASTTVDANGQLLVRILPGQESFRIAPLLQANCWAIVPDGFEDLAAGEIIAVAPMSPGDFPAPSD